MHAMSAIFMLQGLDILL